MKPKSNEETDQRNALSNLITEIWKKGKIIYDIYNI